MAGPAHKLTEAIGRFWSSITGRKPASATPALPPVVLHDPQADRPHDLDDPFFDQKVQQRMAEVIANAAQKK